MQIGTDLTNNTVANDANRFSELSSEEFIKIMLTELSNQDPTQPQDSSKLLDQISSLRSIESNMQLMGQMDDLVGQNQFATAANLVGKHVIGRDEQSMAAQGTVTAAGIEDDEIILTLENGVRVPFKFVEEISLLPSGSE